MKKLFVLVVLAVATLARAQDTVPANMLYAWKTPTATGQLGRYIILNNTTGPRPTNYTIDVTVTGTIPTACTFRVEGSYDGSAWYGLDTTAPAAQSCTANFMEHIAYRPVNFLRVNLVTLTGGTSIIFHFTGGH